MYANQNIQNNDVLIEYFDIKQGRYYWLFLALISVFAVYFVVDCFNIFGMSGGSDSSISASDCGCEGGSNIVLSTSGI